MVFVPTLLAASLATGLPGNGPDTLPPMPPDLRALVADAYRLADAVGPDVWAGWHEVPFPVLLVTDRVEYLVGHEHPDSTFVAQGVEEQVGAVYARPRQMQPDLLATFPAVGGVPTVIVGTPARTDREPDAWVLTLLHEHFHQYQMTRPDYYAGVNALDLADGDSSGMWMLTYPFPYDSTPVAAAFGNLQTALHEILTGTGAPATVWLALGDLYTELSPRDRRYLEFQLWQEGIARYTEIAVARRSPRYASQADQLMQANLERLRTERLGQDRRGAFYAVGAALGLLLERDRGWPGRYWSEPFTIRIP